jgi:tetratricopeptide (TPR) repeat protein
MFLLASITAVVFLFAIQLPVARSAQLLVCSAVLIVATVIAGILMSARPAPENPFVRSPEPPAPPEMILVEKIRALLPDHPRLASLDFVSLVEFYELWDSRDLVRHLKENLRPDAHSVARIHEAAALSVLSFFDRAREVLFSMRPFVPALFAKAEFLETVGDLHEAADTFARLRGEANWSPGAQAGLLERELRVRARIGAHQQIRAVVNDFLRTTTDSAVKIYLLEALATLPISIDLCSFLQEALYFIDRAIRLSPQSARLKALKGALLYENLEREMSRQLFYQALTAAPSLPVSAVCHFYLALLERKRGHVTEARSLAQKAARSQPENWLAIRIRREFAI